MLTLVIPNPSGRRKPIHVTRRPEQIHTPADKFLSRQEILNRHLNKCFFKIGDAVTLKKPKRPRIRGVVVAVEETAEYSQWVGNQPKFITIEVPVIDKDTKIQYGTEKRNVGVKQLLITSG